MANNTSTHQGTNSNGHHKVDYTGYNIPSNHTPGSHYNHDDRGSHYNHDDSGYNPDDDNSSDWPHILLRRAGIQQPDLQRQYVILI